MENLPTSSLFSTKRITLLVFASAIGIGCIACTANWWLKGKQKNDLRRRRRKSKEKRLKRDSAEFAFVQDYLKGRNIIQYPIHLRGHQHKIFVPVNWAKLMKKDGELFPGHGLILT